MQSRIKTTGYLVIALIVFMLSILNVYAVKALDVLGTPVFFAFSILIEIILLVIFVYSLVKGLTSPRSVASSLLRSAWSGLRRDPYIKGLRKTDSSFLRWCGARFDTRKPQGLMLTSLIIIAGTFLAGFVGVLQDVIFKDPLTRIDTRIANLVPSIRTDEQTRFFNFITSLANVETIGLLLLIVGGILWYRRLRLSAGIFVVVSLGAEVTNYIVKHLVSRTRPEQSLSLIREDGYSFPSGHVMAATVVFGLLAYYIYRSTKSSAVKLLVLVSYISAVFLVALSRIYLGVHYPSDVIASALFGSFILSIVVGVIEIAIRFKLAGITHDKVFDKQVYLAVPAILVFALVANPFLVKIRPIMATPSQTPLAALNQETVKRLPVYSETLTGSRMEPISFIFVGYGNQVEKIFDSHGWYKSDPSTLSNTLRALAIGFQDKQYLNAPVTPSYLNAKPQDLAFQKPTDANTLKQRHHTRIWRTDYVLPDGRPIWVATASLDDGVKFAGPAKLPTHHIDPNIDAERNFIAQSLGVPNDLMQVVNSQLGMNASDDPFYTDGKAIIINL